MNNLDTSIDVTDVSPRLKYYKRGESCCVKDIAPPIYVLPFIMNPNGKNIQYFYLHEYQDMFNTLKTTVLDISPYNFETKIDVLKAFVSKYFSIPTSKIDKERIFYLGETDINLSLFKSEVVCYAFNLTGLVQDNEVKVKLENEDSNLVRVQYYDVLKGHYLDVMTMATVFQLMSYFMI